MEGLNELEDENQRVWDKMKYYSFQLDSTTIKVSGGEKVHQEAEKVR